MADKRDKRTQKTPPLGVATQIAPPGNFERPGSDTGENFDEDTPVGLETLDAQADARLRNRVKETHSDIRVVKETAQATQTGIDTLRFETKRDVQRIENKLGMVDSRVGGLETKVTSLDVKMDQHTGQVTGHVIRMVEVVGELKGKVGELVKDADAKRERDHVAFETDAHVEKTAKVTAISDAADSRKVKRQMMLIRYGWVTAVLGLITAAFAAGRC